MKRKGARLGQHFLTRSTVARAVAEAAVVVHGDSVLEVGPGKGILTAELLDMGAEVVAIEKDSEMVRILSERFANEIATKRLVLIEDDIRDYLRKPQRKNNPYKVVANIPYYLTGELVRMLLEAGRPPTDISLLVQKEVAERIARDKKESILSISVKTYGEPTYVKTVPRGSFSPPPNVDSAILAIRSISKRNFKNIDEKHFFHVVKTGFSQKRKTLGKLLKAEFGEGALVALRESEIPEMERAERLPVEKWLMLAQKLPRT